ncbi:Importin subunit beta-1 [Diplonema papillatum]|nr:Importin subunit beta-1 [Diplonema papillatum]
MSLTEILLNANHPTDAQARQRAQQQIDAAENGSIEDYIGSLMQELSDETKPQGSRMLAGTLMKNLVSSRDPAKREQLAKRWLCVQPAVRSTVKSLTLSALASPERYARTTAALVTAHIARVELPVNQWPECLPQLCHAAGPQPADRQYLRESALMCIGYLCEECEAHVLTAHAGPILSAVLSASSKDEPHPTVRKEALKALTAGLDFMQPAMEDPTHRTRVLTILCEAASRTTQPQADLDCREAAVDGLVVMVSLYYDKLKDYMQALFSLSVDAIRNDHERVAMKALIFWTTVADVEYEILESGMGGGGGTEFSCMNYALGASKYLVEPLWEILLKQPEEVADDEEWDIVTAATGCLGALACAMGDDLADLVMPSIRQNIQRSDSWSHVNAAVVAFGALQEGLTPDGRYTQIVQEMLPVVLSLSASAHPVISDAATWCLSLIAEFHSDVIFSRDMLRPVLEQTVSMLATKPPRSACRASLVLFHVAKATGGVEETEATNALSPFISVLAEALVATIDRQDVAQSNLRAAAAEALGQVVCACAEDCAGVLAGLLPAVLDRLESSLSHDAAQVGEYQGLLSSIVHFLYRKLKTKAAPLGDRVMTSLLLLLKSHNTTVCEEALMATGSVATSIGESFTRYLPFAIPPLVDALRNHATASVFAIAAGTLSDMTGAVKKAILPHCNEVVVALLDGLRAAELEQSVKPKVLATFGDIALAVEEDFVTYLPVVMNAVSCAAKVTADEVKQNKGDEDLMDFYNELRENMCVCYTGILLGMKQKAKAAFSPYVPQVIELVVQIGTEYSPTMPTETVTAALYLLGDVGNVYGKEVHSLLSPAVRHIMSNAANSPDEEIAEAAKYAMSENG